MLTEQIHLIAQRIALSIIDGRFPANCKEHWREQLRIKSINGIVTQEQNDTVPWIFRLLLAHQEQF